MPVLNEIRHALGFHFPDLHDFEFRLVVRGRAVMKKRSQKVHQVGGHSSIGWSSEYKAWERDAAAELAAQWLALFRSAIPADVALNLCVLTYLPDRRGWPDLSATYEGPQDVLEAHKPTCKPKCQRHAGIITNDRQVFGHVGSERRIDAQRPRTELILTPHRVVSGAAGAAPSAAQATGA